MTTRMTRESIKYRVYPWKIRNEDDDNNNNITGLRVIVNIHIR